MAVRAVRGAIQLDHDDRDDLLAGVTKLIEAVMEQNGFTVEDLISMLFTATPDLKSEFPAVAARDLGIVDVPLMCAQEIDVAGAMPRVIRLLAHVDTLRSRHEIQHVYLGGAAALRKDIAQ